MTNTLSLSPETTGEWPTDPNSYQHNKPLVTVLNFNVCLIYQTKIKISNDGCIKQFDSPSLEKIYVQTNLWLEFSRRRSTPTSCNTLLHNGTGQAHTVGSTDITIPGLPRSSKVYSSWNNIDQFAKPTKKELSSIQRERGIKRAINNPANPSRGRTISCLCSTVTVNLVFFERFYQRTPPEENNNNRTEKF